MKNEKIRYVSYLNVDTQKYEVGHIQDGSIIDDIDDKFAAQVIAQLACMGYLFRGDDGAIFLCSHSHDEDVETIEDYIAACNETNADDGPEIEDEDAESQDADVELCPPRDQLEHVND